MGLLGLGLALVAGALWPGPLGRVATPGEARIGLVPGPIHTDILLPLTPVLRRDFAFLVRRGLPVDDPRARWLVVGWGAAEFHTSAGRYQDIRAGAVWRANSRALERTPTPAS